jgi:hypothetical protein
VAQPGSRPPIVWACVPLLSTAVVLSRQRSGLLHLARLSDCCPTCRSGCACAWWSVTAELSLTVALGGLSLSHRPRLPLIAWLFPCASVCGILNGLWCVLASTALLLCLLSLIACVCEWGASCMESVGGWLLAMPDPTVTCGFRFSNVQGHVCCCQCWLLPVLPAAQCLVAAWHPSQRCCLVLLCLLLSREAAGIGSAGWCCGGFPQVVQLDGVCLAGHLVGDNAAGAATLVCWGQHSEGLAYLSLAPPAMPCVALFCLLSPAAQRPMCCWAASAPLSPL